MQKSGGNPKIISTNTKFCGIWRKSVACIGNLLCVSALAHEAVAFVDRRRTSCICSWDLLRCWGSSCWQLGSSPRGAKSAPVMTPVPCYDPPEGLGTGGNPVPLMGDTGNVNVVTRRLRVLTRSGSLTLKTCGPLSKLERPSSSI